MSAPTSNHRHVIAAGPVCVYCGDEVRPSRKGTWREVTGWVEQRSGGGAHGVREQKPTGRFACPRCMALVRCGVDVDQGRLC